MLRSTHLQAAVLTAAALLAVFSPSSLNAHVDPSGDVSPSVRVENGRFVIDFTNNQDNELDSHDRNRFRMIFRSDGSLIAPRHRTRVNDNRYRNPVLTSPPETQVGKERISFDLHTKRPSSLITRDDGSRKRVSLPWPDDDEQFTLFDSGSATATHFALLGTRWIENDPLQGSELFIYRFKRGSPNPPEIYSLGKVATIYDSPICSYLLAVNGRFWVAWMKANSEDRKWEAMLTSVGSGKDDLDSRVLDAPGHWNTHPSMAAIGNRLCIAYHYGHAYRHPLTTSRIVTVFEDAVVKPGDK